MWLPKFLRKKKDRIPETEENVCCETCGCDEFPEGRYGELLKGKWHYWCKKCYMQRFIASMYSSPQLFAKYVSIYGKRPEEVIK